MPVNVIMKKRTPYFFIGLEILFTILFICEVPGIVFWAPTLLFAVFIAEKIMNKETFSLPLSALVLSVFSVVFIFFKYDETVSLYYQAYISVQAVFLYVIGYNFFPAENAEKKIRYFEIFIFIISAVYVLYVGITFLHHYCFTAADLKPRFYYSLWYPTVKKPATVISMCFVFPLSLGAFWLFFSEKRLLKIIGAVFVALTLTVNILTSTRTLVYLTPIVLLCVFFAWIIFKKKKYKFGIIVTALTVCIIVCVLVYYFTHKTELIKQFRGTVFSRFIRGGFTSTLRWKYTKNVLDDFSFTYLGGGVHSLTYGTPHNIWLYIYDYGGIVSFIIYLLFSFMLAFNFFRFLANKALSTDIRVLIAAMFGVIFVEYMLEPFMEPLPSFYMLTYFIFGAFSSLSVYKRKKTLIV